MTPLLSTKAAAMHLGIGIKQFRKLVAARKLTIIQFPETKQHKFRREDLAAYVDKCAVRGEA